MSDAKEWETWWCPACKAFMPCQFSAGDLVCQCTLVIATRKEPPAAVQAGDVREDLGNLAEEVFLVVQIFDRKSAGIHGAYSLIENAKWKAGCLQEDAGKTKVIVVKYRRAEAQPPALKALVEAARMYSDRLEHGKYCDSHHRPYVATTTAPPKCDCGYDALRAALTPFLDSAQPKREGQ